MRGLRVLPGSEVELRAVMRTHGPLISRMHLPGLGLYQKHRKKTPAPACEPADACALFGPGSARKEKASAFALYFHVRVFQAGPPLPAHACLYVSIPEPDWRGRPRGTGEREGGPWAESC